MKAETNMLIRQFGAKQKLTFPNILIFKFDF